MINLTVRSRKDVVSELDRVAALKHLDKAQLLRIILEKGLEKEKLDLAIELYSGGETMERAANLANVSTPLKRRRSWRKPLRRTTQTWLGRS